jgi:hypothetical protein
MYSLKILNTPSWNTKYTISHTHYASGTISTVHISVATDSRQCKYISVSLQLMIYSWTLYLFTLLTTKKRANCNLKHKTPQSSPKYMNLFWMLFSFFFTDSIHLKWVPFHHCMARPQAADGGDSLSDMEGKLPIYWISSCRQPTGGGPQAWGLGRGLTTPQM